MTEREHLFDEFSPATYEAWRAAAEKTLKGASFDKKLITRTYEGIDLQPIYRQEDSADIPHTNTMPGFPPYIRSTHVTGYCVIPWAISQEIPYATPKAFNEALRADIERGQDTLNLVVDVATRMGLDANAAHPGEVGAGGVSISTATDMGMIIKDIDLRETALFLQAGSSALPLAALLLTMNVYRGPAVRALTGCIGMDPLGTLARDGSLHHTLNEAYDEMVALTTWACKDAPKLSFILVQSHPYHDGGASVTQELAFTLATGVEYMREMINRGLSVNQVATHMRFAFSIGSNVFLEIAKLRAARLLWAKIIQAFGGNDDAQKMVIHGRTSSWNKTIYDPYVNMLRTTTESFAGVIGGCNSLHISPFDEPVGQPDEFSRRIARNTHSILRDESHLDRVIDPAGGSWYVEWLTDSVARKAWEIFQEVEKQGGMYAALQADYPQNAIAQVAEQRGKNIDTRRDVVVGTNMYPNLNEKPAEVRRPDYNAVYKERSDTVTMSLSLVKKEHCDDALAKLLAVRESAPTSMDIVKMAMDAVHLGASLGMLSQVLYRDRDNLPTIHPVCIHRATERFERLRKQAEAYAARTGTLPRAFLATMGPIPQHKPRADFSTGFLQVGGFEVIYQTSFATPDEAAQAALESQAPIVVICSTDETYPDIVPPLTQQIKASHPDTLVILAGYPHDQVEAHKAAGIDDFIHLRANCYEMLQTIQKKIGVAE